VSTKLTQSPLLLDSLSWWEELDKIDKEMIASASANPINLA
jgi:hypothetical protein